MEMRAGLAVESLASYGWLGSGPDGVGIDLEVCLGLQQLSTKTSSYCTLGKTNNGVTV